LTEKRNGGERGRERERERERDRERERETYIIIERREAIWVGFNEIVIRRESEPN